jgi:hypothetical protein
VNYHLQRNEFPPVQELTTGLRDGIALCNLVSALTGNQFRKVLFVCVCVCVRVILLPPCIYWYWAELLSLQKSSLTLSLALTHALSYTLTRSCTLTRVHPLRLSHSLITLYVLCVHLPVA